MEAKKREFMGNPKSMEFSFSTRSVNKVWFSWFFMDSWRFSIVKVRVCCSFSNLKEGSIGFMLPWS